MLRSVPGIGPVISVTMLAMLPELGTLNYQKIAASRWDPTQPLPVILGINTRRTYFQSATLFYKRAEEIIDNGLLVKLLML